MLKVWLTNLKKRDFIIRTLCLGYCLEFCPGIQSCSFTGCLSVKGELVDDMLEKHQGLL